MQRANLKIASLNVNGLNNPKKRGKVLKKFSKEKMHVIFLQETHLSQQEHEKLKHFGYGITFYSSHSRNNKRGVAILISNALKYEKIKEIKDKDGRYILVKGKLEDQMITLINVYAPPDSDKCFFKGLFDIITQETEGIMILGGDFNVTLKHNLDTTSTKKNSKAQLTRYLNTTLSELGIADIWRETHPLNKKLHLLFIPTFSIYKNRLFFHELRRKIQGIRM